MKALRVAAAVDLGLVAALLHLAQLAPWWVVAYLVLAGVAVLPGMFAGLW